MNSPTPLQMLLDSLATLLFGNRAELGVAFVVAVIACSLATAGQNWYRGNPVVPCAVKGALTGLVFGICAVLVFVTVV